MFISKFPLHLNLSHHYFQGCNPFLCQETNRIYNKQVTPKGYKRGGGVTETAKKQAMEAKPKTKATTNGTLTSHQKWNILKNKINLDLMTRRVVTLYK